MSFIELMFKLQYDDIMILITNQILEIFNLFFFSLLNFLSSWMFSLVTSTNNLPQIGISDIMKYLPKFPDISIGHNSFPTMILYHQIFSLLSFHYQNLNTTKKLQGSKGI